MGRFAKLTFAQKTCVSSAGRIMQRTGMIRPGARIGVAASGGVDSFVLSQVLLIRKAIVPFDLELMLLHINPGFDGAGHQALVDWAADKGLALHAETTDIGPRAHSPENRKNSPCFFCAMLRRKRLFNLCERYNLTHLALGHNADDLVSTFFMNMTQNGRVDGLTPSEPFFGGRLQVIRPLLFLDKPTIKTAARQWGLPVWENPCPSAGRTKRDEVFDWVAQRWQGNRKIKTNIYNALERLTLEKYPPIPPREPADRPPEATETA